MRDTNTPSCANSYAKRSEPTMHLSDFVIAALIGVVSAAVLIFVVELVWYVWGIQ